MHFEFDSEGYVKTILYGCYTGSCIEYNGSVPSEPEEYADMDDWADNAKVQAYYLDAKGNLAYDANRAASLCDEDEVVCKKYTTSQIKDMGIFDAIYPVGSLYMSVNNVSPATLFGGTWVQIQDRFILAAGSTYSGGSESSTGVSRTATVNIPAHKHLTPLVKSGNYLGFWTNGDTKSLTQSNRVIASGGSYSDSATATTYYTATDGATSTSVTVPPTLPPYLAVYVWQRVEDPIPENYQNFIDADGKKFIDANAEEFMVEVS